MMTGSESPTRPQPTAEPVADQADPRRAEIPHDLFCQECGYNLRALTSDRCPECGHSLETVRAVRSQIPWVYRKGIGRFRAYWRTVWLVMFRQRRFCEEMARPVSYRDCQRFRWVTILHVYVPILLATAAVYVIDGLPNFSWVVRRLPPDHLVYRAFDAVWPIAVAHLLLLLCLAVATGVPSYFFHPRGIPIPVQNRAIALSYYACAPLAVSAIPIAAAANLLLAGGAHGDTASLALAAVLPVAQVYAWLSDLIRIGRRVMPRNRWRPLLILVCVPVLWIILAALVLVGLPLGVFSAYLIFATRG